MGCGDFQQIRLGEMLEFAFDSGGNLKDNPLDLSSSIDVGGANKVAVSITPCSIDLDGATSIEFVFRTAPINGDAFFAAMQGGGTNIEMSFNSTNNQFETAEGLSRFWGLAPKITGSPTSEAKLVCTIDVLLRA